MKLSVSSRTGNKKSDVKKLRREGQVPAVLYGPGKENKSVSFPLEQLQETFRKIESGGLATTVFDLEDGKNTVKALIKEIQYHPVSYNVLHVDFIELDQKTPVRVNIPLRVTGQIDCVGIKLGGFLRQVIRSMKVECLPKDLPADIEMDIRHLAIGDSKKLKDLPIPANVKPLAHMEEAAVLITKRA